VDSPPARTAVISTTFLPSQMFLVCSRIEEFTIGRRRIRTRLPAGGLEGDGFELVWGFPCQPLPVNHLLCENCRNARSNRRSRARPAPMRRVRLSRPAAGSRGIARSARRLCAGATRRRQSVKSKRKTGDTPRAALKRACALTAPGPQALFLHFSTCQRFAIHLADSSPQGSLSADDSGLRQPRTVGGHGGIPWLTFSRCVAYGAEGSDQASWVRVGLERVRREAGPASIRPAFARLRQRLRRTRRGSPSRPVGRLGH
jgi:hypothetical protein